jgi:hypothetical protein
VGGNSCAYVDSLITQWIDASNGCEDANPPSFFYDASTHISSTQDLLNKALSLYLNHGGPSAPEYISTRRLYDQFGAITRYINEAFVLASESRQTLLNAYIDHKLEYQQS